MCGARLLYWEKEQLVLYFRYLLWVECETDIRRNFRLTSILSLTPTPTLISISYEMHF